MPRRCPSTRPNLSGAHRFRELAFCPVYQALAKLGRDRTCSATTSMGRLTLNMLLSLAQFEREVSVERIRDKIAASKRKGMWMGGPVPLGYDVYNRKLVINPKKADFVRHISGATSNSTRWLNFPTGSTSWVIAPRPRTAPAAYTRAAASSGAVRSTICSPTRSTAARLSTRARSSMGNTTTSSRSKWEDVKATLRANASGSS